MSDKMVINDYNELLDYALCIFNGWEKVKSIELTEDFNYHIVLKGKDWDEHFDQRTAEITLKVYDAIALLVAKSENISVSKVKQNKKPRLRVVVKVEKGSQDLYIKILDVLQAALDKMTGTEIIILAGLVAAGFVGANIAKYRYKYLVKRNSELHNERLKDMDIKERQEIAKNSNANLEIVLKNNADLISKTQKTLKIISKRMADDDVAFFPSTGQELTRKEIKDLLAPIDPEPIAIHYVDGEYVVRMWSHYDENIASIEREGVKLPKVLIKLDEDNKKQLALHLDSLQCVSLQVTVSVQGGKAVEAEIVGIGEPRQGFKQLKELID